MLQFAHSRRIRRRQYKKRHVKPRRTLGRETLRQKQLKAFWKGNRSNIAQSTFIKDVKNKYPISTAMMKTVGRRFSRNKKQIMSRNRLRSEL